MEKLCNENKYQHSRNRDGLVEVDGKAVLTSHSSFENLIQFLEKLAFRLANADGESLAFEVTRVDIAKSTGSGICSNESEDFDGFSDISEGEYTCLLQIIQERKDEKIKRIEEKLEKNKLR